MDMRSMVGRNVLRIRLEKALSQEELAARSGFNQHYISELEAGKRNPTALSLYELAVGLGVPPADLVALAEGIKVKRTRR
jgi:transcriptional regulator with XRE-family HTH domain